MTDIPCILICDLIAHSSFALLVLAISFSPISAYEKTTTICAETKTEASFTEGSPCSRIGSGSGS